MEINYIYLPLTIKRIEYGNNDIESWFYLGNDENIDVFLSNVFDIEDRLIVDEEGNNLRGKTGQELISWTNISIIPRSQKIKKETNFLRSFSLEYYEPRKTVDPAIIISHLKRQIIDSEVPSSSQRLQIKNAKNNIYLLCRNSDSFTLYQFDKNFQNQQQVMTFKRTFYPKFDIKGFSIWKDNLLYYNSREIFIIGPGSQNSQTIHIESDDNEIYKLKICGKKGIILVCSQHKNIYSIKIINLETKKIINEIEIRNLWQEISDYAVFGNINYIISTKEGRINIHSDSQVRSFNIFKKDETFYDDVLLEMDDMNNLYILAKGRIYITDGDFYPKASFKIEGAELISVLENEIVLHSRHNAFHKIVLNPTIISNLVKMDT